MNPFINGDSLMHYIDAQPVAFEDRRSTPAGNKWSISATKQ